MSFTDPVADYLTRIRNAQAAGHKLVEIPSSKLKQSITEILYDQGYISKYIFEDVDGKSFIKIAIKYDKKSKSPVIKSLKRISTPGLRQYVKVDELPRVINGLGIAIVSTSKGVMTSKQAQSLNIGGEVLCYIY